MSALLCLGFCCKWYEPKEKCCICVPLRPGSVAIGYSLVVLKSLLLLITCAVYVMYTEDSARPENAHINYTFILAINTICIIIQITEILLAIILIIGLHTNKLAVIKVFVIGGPVSFTILGVFFIIAIIKGVVTAENTGEWGLFIPEMVFADFYVYCIIIVKSYYQKMKAPNKDEDSTNVEEIINIEEEAINLEQEAINMDEDGIHVEHQTLNSSTESLV